MSAANPAMNSGLSGCQVLGDGGSRATVLRGRRVRTVVAAMAVAGGIAFSTAVPSAAALDAMTNNWSNWWTAHAEIWIYNKGMWLQSQARLGDKWSFGEIRNDYSRARVDDFNWTHNAFQVRFR
ncbi:hypothetical protein [Arthrobacter sp. M4]|uniref:hypothetical protein n=1 Tax=Arthrobacter sp. M4 TaxID=218160 RepID=UPI001CDB515A|nr:hypothetical protein [Arthrobacter sp. M4]MCA4134904.1 hypothetical protein [Arthrobacter sp. M4]